MGPSLVSLALPGLPQYRETMTSTAAFLVAVVIILALMGAAELASDAVSPLSEVIIGEPMCIQPDGSVCAFLEDAR